MNNLLQSCLYFKLANGEIRKEDLDEDTVNRLKDVLYN